MLWHGYTSEPVYTWAYSFIELEFLLMTLYPISVVQGIKLHKCQSATSKNINNTFEYSKHLDINRIDVKKYIVFLSLSKCVVSQSSKPRPFNVRWLSIAL